MNKYQSSTVKIRLHPVRWRNLSNGVSPPSVKGDLGGGCNLVKVAYFEKCTPYSTPPFEKGG